MAGTLNNRTGRPQNPTIDSNQRLQTQASPRQPVSAPPRLLKMTPQQIDDLVDSLLNGDRSAIGQVETRPWTDDEFEAFLLSLEVEIPKVTVGGPFKAGFGRQIVDSTLAEYLDPENDDPFGSILMDYIDGLTD